MNCPLLKVGPAPSVPFVQGSTLNSGPPHKSLAQLLSHTPAQPPLYVGTWLLPG